MVATRTNVFCYHAINGCFKPSLWNVLGMLLSLNAWPSDLSELEHTTHVMEDIGQYKLRIY